MKTTTIRLYSLDYNNVKTYFAAALFILGNLVLPQLCHLIPQGGLTLLPIYFFTLIAAYKYGWKVGLLTAVFTSFEPFVFRYASCRSIAGHPFKIRFTGSGCRICSQSF